MTLYADTLVRDRNRFIRRAQTDSAGAASWDTIAPGDYGLLIRRIGYDPIIGVLHLRAGEGDSVAVSLRYNPACFSS